METLLQYYICTILNNGNELVAITMDCGEAHKGSFPLTIYILDQHKFDFLEKINDAYSTFDIDKRIKELYPNTKIIPLYARYFHPIDKSNHYYTNVNYSAKKVSHGFSYFHDELEKKVNNLNNIDFDNIHKEWEKKARSDYNKYVKDVSVDRSKLNELKKVLHIE